MGDSQFHSDVLCLKDKLFRYALSIVLDYDLAEDVLQETLSKIWLKRRKLSTINNLEAWCITTTKRVALDFLRKKNREKKEEIFFHKTIPLHQSDADILYDDLLEKIKNILADIPEPQREIFRLRDLMGYSNLEIEEILQLNHSQVKVYLFRARKKVRQQLKKIINFGT